MPMHNAFIFRKMFSAAEKYKMIFRQITKHPAKYND